MGCPRLRGSQGGALLRLFESFGGGFPFGFSSFPFLLFLLFLCCGSRLCLRLGGFFLLASFGGGFPFGFRFFSLGFFFGLCCFRRRLLLRRYLQLCLEDAGEEQ